MNVFEPILLDIGDLTDHSASDVETQLQRIKIHQDVFLNYLVGKASFEDLLDSVADFGEDAYEYWNIVEDNIEYIIKNNVSIENAQWLLKKLERLKAA